MTLRELYEAETQRFEAATAVRKEVDELRHQLTLLEHRLAYATRTNKPETTALQALRTEVHDTRIALQRARRRLIRSL